MNFIAIINSINGRVRFSANYKVAAVSSQSDDSLKEILS